MFPFILFSPYNFKWENQSSFWNYHQVYIWTLSSFKEKIIEEHHNLLQSFRDWILPQKYFITIHDFKHVNINEALIIQDNNRKIMYLEFNKIYRSIKKIKYTYILFITHSYILFYQIVLRNYKISMKKSIIESLDDWK